MAIRYALMSDHYRRDRMWSDELLRDSQLAVQRLRLALLQERVHETSRVISEIIAALSDDLNTPLVISVVNSWVDLTLEGSSGGDAKVFAKTLDTLLGIKF